MLYSMIRQSIDSMVEEIAAGKEECYEILSFNLIKDQNVPVTVRVKLIYPLNQVKVSLYCPFLLVDPDIEYQEIYRQGIEEDEFRLMRLISKFSTTLERLQSWIEKDVPDMIRWGEGVIFDKNGRTKKIPYPTIGIKSGKQKTVKT
jgi:hypothetical protein